MRKSTTSSFFAGKFSRLGKVPVGTAKRFCAGALSAALVLTGISVPNKSASAAGAKLNKDSVVLYVGGNATAKIKAKNVNKVTYKSKDTSVAKVNKTTGKITGVGAGKTKVIAKTDAGKLKCAVRVYKAIKTLTPDTEEVTLALGETQTVAVTVKPAKANSTMWEVTTSDKSVAKKQKAGGKKGTFDIIGVGEGTATITVRSTDGGSAPDATVKVTVTEDHGTVTIGSVTYYQTYESEYAYEINELDWRIVATGTYADGTDYEASVDLNDWVYIEGLDWDCDGCSWDACCEDGQDGCTLGCGGESTYLECVSLEKLEAAFESIAPGCTMDVEGLAKLAYSVDDDGNYNGYTETWYCGCEWTLKEGYVYDYYCDQTYSGTGIDILGK